MFATTRCACRGLRQALVGAGYTIRANSTAAKPAAASPALADFRIGRIAHVENHPNADRLYVSQIEVREPQVVDGETVDNGTVQVCSGLVGLVPKEQLLHSWVVLVTNLKPSKMRGEISEAMLLAAEKPGEKEGEWHVEVVRPPKAGTVGQRVQFKGLEGTGETKRLKKKQWEEISEGLRTNGEGQVCFKEDGALLGYTDTTGEFHACKVSQLKNCNVR